MCVNMLATCVHTHVTTAEQGKHLQPAEPDIDNNEICNVLIQRW